MTQIPFLFTLFYSLTEWRIDTPGTSRVHRVRQLRRPAGRRVLPRRRLGQRPDDGDGRPALAVVGTGLAILLDRKFFGQGFVRTLLITPFLVMPVVAGFMWKTQMFNATFGVINWLLDLVGIEPIEFATQVSAVRRSSSCSCGSGARS